MTKKIFLILIFIQLALKIFSIEFKTDIKMYFKVQNQFSDYSYLPKSGIGDLGYKTQYVKLQINSLKNDYYLFSPAYKLYSKEKFDNFYHYSKFKMFPYRFLVKTINMAKVNTADFLFDTRPLLKNLSDSPVTILQRLFLDKNFMDKDGNLIKNPKNKIFILLINSSKFTNLLPDGNYIKDFFVCIYYNENELSDEEMMKSITWNGIPMPIGSHYQKFPIYENSVMAKSEEESHLVKKAEENLYNDLTKAMQEITRKNEAVTKKPKKEKKSQPAITPKNTENISTTILPQKEKKPEKIEKETLSQIKIPKTIKKKQTGKVIKIQEKEKKIEKIKSPEKEIKKPKEKPKQIAVHKENKYSTVKIKIINKNGKTEYPVEENLIFKVQIKGENLKNSIDAKLSNISKVTTIPIEIKRINYADSIKISAPIGYSVNGIYADSVFTTLVNLNNVHKIKIDLKKLPKFPLILIDKSEIYPIEWIGLEPIVKDIKKSINMKNEYGIFYMNNEKIGGNFSPSIAKCYEDYLWDTIYPMATSSGIRMEHLFKLAEKWNNSIYSKRYKPEIHLFLSRATLKSLIAMDNWEMTRKKFKQLREKFGNAEIVIHSKIKKKDNIPLFKLGLPFRKIK